MAIQFRRDQIIDAIINPSKMDLTTGTYNFASVTALTYKTPTSDNEVAIKSYVDSVINGLNWKDTCRAATQASKTGVYSNGSLGVGATLTISNAAVVADGVTLRENDRVLLKSQSKGLENGIYSLTTDGNALGASTNIQFRNTSNMTAGLKGLISLTINNASNFVDNTSTITFFQKGGASSILTAKTSGATGQQFNIGSDNDTATNIANVLNGLVDGGGARLFQAIASTNTVTVYHADSGAHSGTLTNVTNAGTACSFSNSGVITAGSDGDSILFTKADDSTVTFEAVNLTPGAQGDQFAVYGTGLEQSMAAAAAISIGDNPDFTARVSNSDSNAIIVSLVTTGTSGNSKTVTVSSTGGGIIGDPNFANGKALSDSVLTRTTDFDKSGEVASSAVFIEEGTVNDNNGFTCTNNEPIQVGQTALVFVQFNGAGSITAGEGLSRTGNTLDVNVDDASIEIVNDELRIKAGGNGLTGGGASLLAVQNDGATLSVSSSGVKVSDAGITATQLASSVAGLGISGGAGTALALDFSELVDEQIASGDRIAFRDNDDDGMHADTIDDVATLFAGAGLSAASAVMAIDISEFSTATPASLDSFLTLDSDGATEQRTTTDALATLFAGSGGGLQASSAVMSLNLNDLTSAVVDVSADSIAIIDANDSNSTKKESIDDFVTSFASGSNFDVASGVMSIKDNGITLAKVAFKPYVQTFTGSATSTFTLSQRILDTDWQDGTIVSLNGQMLTKVSSLSEDGEFTIADNGVNTVVTLNSAILADESLTVIAFA